MNRYLCLLCVPLLLLAGVLLLANPVQAATTITVTTTADVIADDGECSLREAVLAANSDSAVGDCPAGSGADMIVFAAGLTRPAIFTLTLSGTGEENAQTGDLDVTSDLTIDGVDPASIVIDGNGADRVFDVRTGAHFTLVGVTVRNGQAASNDGGGIKVAAALIMTDTVVEGNAGGGIANSTGSLLLSHVDVISNTSGYGIHNQGPMTFLDGSVSANQGGGIYNSQAIVALSRLAIVGNTGSGGVHNEGFGLSRLTLNASTVLSNTSANGGGILNSGVGAEATISGSRIAYNTASADGGGIFNNGSITVNSSSVDHNQARSGGGVDNFGGTMGLTNVTVSGNSAGDNGGGISNRGSATLTSVTLNANGAAGDGGNLFNDEGQINFRSTIVANPASSGNCFSSNGFITSSNYNLESTDSCGFGQAQDQVDTDPKLDPLQDNGGATPTHALQAGSTALDAIPSGFANCSPGVSTDQRGFPRTEGAGCDIGAFELGETADLALTASASNYLPGPGGPLTYTLVIANLGPSTAMTVTFTDELPTAAAFVDATIDGGACAYSSQVTCSLNILTATQTATATVVITLPAGSGVITSTAIVSATTPDLNLANNTAVIVLGVRTPIHVIQGAGHTSPLVGKPVTTGGIVTAVRNNGFYLQEPNGDGDNATSEAIFVYTGGSPTTTVGDELVVSGQVTEFQPGSPSEQNLTITELTAPSYLALSAGNALPAPVVRGSGGRVPPSTVIEDDDLTVFDPSADGLDFDESLEAMRVQIDDAVVVGPSNRFGEIWVLADNGAGTGPRTARGGIHVTVSDFNPERFQLDDTLYPLNDWPDVSVGARFTAPVVGVVDYSFGNYELLPTAPITVEMSQVVTRPTTALQGDADRVTIATFNVENLGGNASDAAFTARANLIVNHLAGPDILVLEEIQDNNGAADDGTTAADVTYSRLISAVQAAGGPLYAFQQIDPQDKQDGGAPGGNIRVGFLYDPSRVSSAAASSGDATTPNSVACASGVAALTLNPGRVDPTNAAFTDSRKPLAGQFTFAGKSLFVVGVHFSSKGGDTPLYGALQPPVLNSETQRLAQAQAVHDFVATILACEPGARVIVLGDVNDYPFSAPVATLKGTLLSNLMDLLPANTQYSYIYQGNSQVLDQALVSAGLLDAQAEYDVVHVNAEFFDQVSDHDPSVARFNLTALALQPAIYLPLVAK